MIDINKKYHTRDGREVRIYATDGGGHYPVHGAIKKGDDYWDVAGWTINGASLPIVDSSDLIEAKPRIKRTVWLNLYAHTTITKSSRENADAMRAGACLACVKVEIDCEEGEGL